MSKKRPVSQIIVHCSASPANTKVGDIRAWHKAKGWKDIGYHLVIEGDGLIKNGRNKDMPGAHCEGHNSDSLGICMVGGMQSSGKMVNFTQEQLISLRIVIEGIFLSYGRLPVYPHHKYNPHKSCPNFRVTEWLSDGMPSTPQKYTTKNWK